MDIHKYPAKSKYGINTSPQLHSEPEIVHLSTPDISSRIILILSLNGRFFSIGGLESSQ